MKQRLFVTTAAALLVVVASGCATKKYVAGEVATVNERVDGVSTQVEDAQTKLRDHEGRLGKNASDTAAA